MRLDQAFQKAGFEIVSADKTKDGSRLTFEVRVPLQGQVPGRWKLMLDEVLTLSETLQKKGNKKWEVDISKKFFSRNGVVRYLWRIVMMGNLSSCQLVFVQSTLASLRSGVELTEVPLVGQENLTPDLKNGRVRGAYTRNEDDRASSVVAGAMMGNGGVGFRPMEDNPRY